MTNRILLLLAALLAACSDPVVEFPPSGSVAYQHATLCTSSALAPAVQAAADRWHAAAERVAMRVRVVADPEVVQDGCAVNVFVASMAQCAAGPDGDAHCLAFGGAGIVALDPAAVADAELSDILTHELGHNLLGAPYAGEDPAHSAEETSVMFWASRPGEQAITAADIAALP